MANFTPISAAIGGALIGLAAVLLMLFNGRIAGVSGIADGLVNPRTDDRLWRVAFVVGLIAAPFAAALLGHAVPMPQMPASYAIIADAGLWSASAPGLAAAAPPATASAALRGCRRARSRPPWSS